MTELNQDTNRKVSKAVISLLVIFCLIGLVSTISTILFNTTNTVINQILDIIIYILIFLYFIKFYKKAHSNALRYIIVFYCFVTAYNGLTYKPISKMIAYALIVSSLLTIFVSARLNKFKQNRWILTFSFILMLFGTVYCLYEMPDELFASYNSIQKFVYQLSFFNPLLQFSCLSLSYMSRSYRHILAGKEADAGEEI